MEELVDPAVFDAAAVSSMTGDPGDAEFGVEFVSRYRRLLPTRLTRIAACLVAGDPDDALDAVLSLKVASATVGARELAELASRLAVLLRRGDLGQAVLAESTLGDAAVRADGALAVFLAR